MTTPLVKSTTDELIEELEAAAKSFDNLDFDSNTNPFFNGPSGESMGGEADGTFCVYGEPFEIDGDVYDGVTFVERCSRSQAKFIAESKQNILTLIARIRELEARTVTLPPPYPVPEPDEYSIDDSYMDPYYAANGMRSACSSFIKNAGIKVVDPHSPDHPL